MYGTGGVGVGFGVRGGGQDEVENLGVVAKRYL